MESQFTQTDQELVSLSKNDPEAFGMLMERYERPLLSYIKRLTGWRENEAEEILQESFIKAYRSLNTYDANLKFSSWLYRIVHNQTIDTLRKEHSRPFVSSFSLEDVAHILQDDTDIEAEFIKEEAFTKIKQAIYGLPLKYREVLILRFLEEKEYDEIVDILKKPKGSIATLIRRGRKMLLENIQ